MYLEFVRYIDLILCYSVCVDDQQRENWPWYSELSLNQVNAQAYLSFLLWNTFKKTIVVAKFVCLLWDEGKFRDQLFDAPRTFYDLFLMSEILQSIWEEPMNVMGTLHRLLLTMGNLGTMSTVQHCGIQTMSKTTG
jgi:hypothetical protein